MAKDIAIALKPFDKTILDALSTHIAILNKEGIILETNSAWRKFGESNDIKGSCDSKGINYLSICEMAAGRDTEFSKEAAQGIRAVLSSKIDEFTLEYPCHSPTEKRWFYMRVTRVRTKGPFKVVVGHENITPLKLAEEKLREHELELELKSKTLEESNIALKVLLQQREKDKVELEEHVASNIRQVVLHYVEKMKNTRLNKHQAAYMGIIESHLIDVTSPLIHKISSRHLQLTPSEIQVAVLVKEGKATKDISKILNISTNAVDFHRKNIRKKLGITNTQTNLHTFLRSIS